jgi:hypothetical protein
MKKEYNFSKGVKGKFYIPEDEIDIPVYLDKENRQYFMKLSREKKIGLSKLINKVLEKDREIIESIR